MNCPTCGRQTHQTFVLQQIHKTSWGMQYGPETETYCSSCFPEERKHKILTSEFSEKADDSE